MPEEGATANQKQKPQESDGVLSNYDERKPAIRTMKSDVEELFKTTKPSLIQVLGQEVTTSGRPPPTKKESALRRYYPVFIVALAAGAAIIGVILFLASRKETDGTPIKLIPPAPFFATETSRTISVGAGERALFLRLMEDSSRELEREGNIKRILVKIKDGPAERFATLADFLEFYRITPPVNFLSNLGSPLMLFFYYGRDGSRFGLSLRTADPDRTWRDLLGWEPALLRDFTPLFFDEKPEVVISPFEDRTYRNIDWRFLKLSPKKDLGIGYTIFPVGDVLLLTTSKEATETVINRLFDAR